MVNLAQAMDLARLLGLSKSVCRGTLTGCA
jgi:hypothetical protein